MKLDQIGSQYLPASGAWRENVGEEEMRNQEVLFMPSVLPDFGTNIKNGHEERTKDCEQTEVWTERCRLSSGWCWMLPLLPGVCSNISTAVREPDAMVVILRPPHPPLKEPRDLLRTSCSFSFGFIFSSICHTLTTFIFHCCWHLTSEFSPEVWLTTWSWVHQRYFCYRSQNELEKLCSHSVACWSRDGCQCTLNVAPGHRIERVSNFLWLSVHVCHPLDIQ